MKAEKNLKKEGEEETQKKKKKKPAIKETRAGRCAHIQGTHTDPQKKQKTKKRERARKHTLQCI